MKQTTLLEISLTLALGAVAAGCGVRAQADPAAGAPPPAQVEKETNGEDFKVDHPEQFPLATAGEHQVAPELNVTGTVMPDISRAIPVISIATGRITEIHARVGDTVKKISSC
jgi:membrane fusion protein, heavy metal efflux system